MRGEGGKVSANGRVMLVVRSDKNAVPLPATGFRRLDQHEHQTLVEICGKPAEHPLGEEG